MISVSSLGKNYGNLVAVDDLNFQIGRGEIFGLLGPNGAGKSTTISMMIGLLTPDRGEVRVGVESGGAESEGRFGNPLQPEVRRRIGISPQSISLYEELSARENLEFFGRLYGLSGKELRHRSDWSLEFAGLTERQKNRVSNYSGGMKRRLNIAAALMHQPDILLLDEPTVGVDPQSRNHILEAIESLKQNGLTVIYTTHYMDEAQRLCDRVAIMDNGKLLALDSVDQLVGQHGGCSMIAGEVANGLEVQSSKFELVHRFQQDGNRITFDAEFPFEAIGELTGAGVRFETLNVARPNLESVFLTLTGRKLRD